jgi:hypothetical protein
VDDRFAVEVVEVGENSRFELILGCAANAAEPGSGHLGEEPFHQVEPGAVFRGKHQGEAALWLGGKPPVGLLGDVCRVVVEDQLDSGVRRIGGVDFLEKADELPRAMPILDTGVNLAGEQIDPGEQAQRAMAFAFMLTRPARMRPRLRWQVGRSAADRLDARLLVVGDDRKVRAASLSRKTATSR